MSYHHVYVLLEQQIYTKFTTFTYTFIFNLIYLTEYIYFFVYVHLIQEENSIRVSNIVFFNHTLYKVVKFKYLLMEKVN